MVEKGADHHSKIAIAPISRFGLSWKYLLFLPLAYRLIMLWYSSFF